MGAHEVAFFLVSAGQLHVIDPAKNSTGPFPTQKMQETSQQGEQSSRPTPSQLGSEHALVRSLAGTRQLLWQRCTRRKYAGGP